MPEFSPSESKTAIAPITAKPAGMDCEAELFLGPDDVTKVASSSRVPFVSIGASQNIRLPITMPSEGTYHGYIDVFTNGLRFLAYKTVEDVVIVAPVPQFYMPSKISGRAKYAPLLQWQYHYVDFWNSITNKGNAAGTVRLTYYDTIGFIQGTITMALEPGETKVWRVGAGMRIDFTRASPYTLTLIGDWAGDNVAKITVRSSQLSYVRGSDWVDV